MKKNFVNRLINGLAAIALGVFVGAGSVQAGNVRLSWTPDFGDPYPNLSFAGTALLDFPNDCLTVAITVIFAGTGCDVGGTPHIAFSEVSLSLWDNPTETGDPSTTLDFLPVSASVIDNIIVENNLIVGINTEIFGFVNTPAGSPIGGLPGGSRVWMQFTTPFTCGEFSCSHGDPLSFMFVAAPAGFEGDTELCPIGGEEFVECVRSNEAPVHIPEPGSLALILGAMGAGLASWRRRRS